MRSAPQTYERKKDAERYLSIVEAQMANGDWTDPARAKVKLGDYATRWITQRPGLRPRTVELYEWLLERYITPYLGGIALGNLETATIRDWRASLLADGVSESMAAKAYRLLRAILMTAVKDDRIIPRNPCQVKGADQEKAAERPVLTMGQVYQLADAVPPRFRALVLLATFASLRYGEITALQRRDLDLDSGLISVHQAFSEVEGRGLVLGPPKSRAGTRVIAVSEIIIPELATHCATYVDDAPEAFVFTGPSGKPIRRGNFRKLIRWSRAVATVGTPNLRFHDLRHTGNTLAAKAGASTKDLMARMGHDSMRAALIYQHATSEADRAIAEALNTHAAQHRSAGPGTDDRRPGDA